MIKVVHINDLHIGLVTEGIDRTKEIISVARQAIKHAVKLKKNHHDVYFVIGGDVFNNNNPSEKLIRDFIEGILNPLKKYAITSFVVAGNHDTISDPDRLSCLGFIKSIGKGYENIELIENMCVKPICTTDHGPLNFIFLPHINRAHLEIDDRKSRYKNTQDYIEKWAEQTKESIGKHSINYVFSHLNVRGAHGGSEENLLKKSESYLPEAFLYDDHGFKKPEIIQSHIHSKDTIGNINIVGSQIYCGFGEAETEKYFLELSIPKSMGEGEDFNYVATNCIQFKQLELNLTDTKWDGVTLSGIKEVQEFLKPLDKNQPTIIKFDITANAKQGSIDWDKERYLISKDTKWKVKPIIPRYVSKKIVRASEQELGLGPKDALKMFIKNNKPDRPKHKWKLAQRYL